jgi:sugar phosphate isomerase/epimerase
MARQSNLVKRHKMKLASSNIGLTEFNHSDELRALPEFGLTGLEVAPSRVWRETWHGLTNSMVEAYRRDVEDAGLEVIGLHSLFWDQRDLGLFRGTETTERTLDFLTHLSNVCRDLGGRTLIFGSAWARRRGEKPLHEADAEATEFFSNLSKRIESHGTCYCFEPVGPDEIDYINSVFDAIKIVEAVDHPALRMQIDAKALVANDEVGLEVFEAAADRLVHYHANDPGLSVLGSTGDVNHAALGGYLRTIGYTAYASIEQRMFNADDPLSDIARSANVLKECYG